MHIAASRLNFESCTFNKCLMSKIIRYKTYSYAMRQLKDIKVARSKVTHKIKFGSSPVIKLVRRVALKLVTLSNVRKLKELLFENDETSLQ